MLEALKLFFLAVLQGVTEFLPVSSSGHLAIFDKLLGLNYAGLRVEIMLHFGTLVAVVFYYWKTLFGLIRGVFTGKRESLATAGLIIVGAVPVAVAGVLLNDWLERKYDGDIAFIGGMLIITGIVLFSLRFLPKGSDKKLTWWRALVIGIAQIAALLPGISRSGSTIAAARYLGLSGKNAADFSFIVSIPLLFGATLLDLMKGEEACAEAVGNPVPGWGLLAPAMVVAMITGYLSIKWLMRAVAGTRFWYFGIYCFIAGVAAILLA